MVKDRKVSLDSYKGKRFVITDLNGIKKGAKLYIIDEWIKKWEAGDFKGNAKSTLEKAGFFHITISPDKAMEYIKRVAPLIKALSKSPSIDTYNMVVWFETQDNHIQTVKPGVTRRWPHWDEYIHESYTYPVIHFQKKSNKTPTFSLWIDFVTKSPEGKYGKEYIVWGAAKGWGEAPKLYESTSLTGLKKFFKV